MKVVLTDRFTDELERQLEYGAHQFGSNVAKRTYEHVQNLVFNVLAVHPLIGRFHEDIDAFEKWIPKAPFVVFYQLDQNTDTVTVPALIGHAQHQSKFDFQPGVD